MASLPMLKLLCVFGAVLGFLGVAAGSFGAHGLKDLLEANGQAANWETAVRYCLFHAVVLVAMSGLASGSENAGLTMLFTIAAGCFVIGVLIFSGCLGVLALTDTHSGGDCPNWWRSASRRATLAVEIIDFASKHSPATCLRWCRWLHHPPDLVPLHAHEDFCCHKQPVS